MLKKKNRLRLNIKDKQDRKEIRELEGIESNCWILINKKYNKTMIILKNKRLLK